MNQKEKMLNNILIAMRRTLNEQEMKMLEHVIVRELQTVDIEDKETLPATIDQRYRLAKR